MSTRNYQALPKHRFPFTKLTEAQISDKLKAAAKGPASKSAWTTALNGKTLKIVTDDKSPENKGPKLEYKFSGNELTLSENGGAAVKAGFGALDSKQLVLISHMIPGTQRGYQVIIDQKSNLATVIETWFSGYEDKREVQREVYLGYVDNGKETPSARHTYTNRLEGKGFYWQQDNDVESLDFYCTVYFSNFIELTRSGGELTFAGPSDYYMINDHQFIYSRVEAEFSGLMTTYLVDLFGTTQTGVRLGFDEKDNLEYYMFRGKGEQLGQIATFEMFGDNVDKTPAPAVRPGQAATPPAKGWRTAYRPLKTFPVMTDAQVRDVILTKSTAFGNGQGSGAAGMGGYKGPLAEHFVGKKITVRMDSNGPAHEYDFHDKSQLRWRPLGDSKWREAWYEMYEADADLFFFAHLMDPGFPGACAMIALDTRNGLSTLVHGQTGTKYRNNETTPTFYFGVFEMEGMVPATYHRHGWTSELVGDAVTWNYQPMTPGSTTPGLTSMHLYLTPNSYSWVIFQNNGSGGSQWSSPGWYSKLRDGVYIMAWVEEACNGTLGVICFNKRTMHDAGFGFHVGPDALSLSTVGARARYAGKFNVEKYIGLKA